MDRHWTRGTVLLAALLERFAPGQEVTFTKAEIEALGFRTSLPVVFTLDDAGERITLKVERPNFSAGHQDMTATPKEPE
jgi:hypothetical protein